MTTKIEIRFNYLVIKCDYTDSLKLEQLECEEIMGSDEWASSGKFLYSYDYGLRLCSKEKRHEEAKKIFDIMKFNNEIQGTAVYKCNHLEEAIQIVDKLAVFNHCLAFSIYSLFRQYLLIDDGVQILVMHFNTESG